MTALNLSGKGVLITGGAVRVGAAIARRLHAAGMNLLVHYNRSAEPAEALAAELNAERPDSAHMLQADLLDIAGLPGLVEQTLARLGRLDLLVNNASTYYPTPLGEIDETHWRDLVGTNAKAPLFLSQAVAPELKRHQGAIINLVDIHANRPNPHHPVYAMAKAANIALIKSLARDLAPEVRVNGVAPGAVLWPDDYMADETRRKILERIPMGRPGEPDDVAEAVHFLATAPYITGEILNVDGGRSTQQ